MKKIMNMPNEIAAQLIGKMDYFIRTCMNCNETFYMEAETYEDSIKEKDNYDKMREHLCNYCEEDCINKAINDVVMRRKGKRIIDKVVSETHQLINKKEKLLW
jgi:hypothetical protein